MSDISRARRDVRRLRSSARDLREQDNQFIQGNATAAGDVECSCLAGFARANVCVHYVFHEREVSALRAIPVNRHRSVTENRRYKFRNYSRVLGIRVLARSEHIEVAQGNGGYAVDLLKHRAVELAGAKAEIFLNLAWYELLSIFLILAGEGLLFAGYGLAGVIAQEVNLVLIVIAIGVLNGDRVELLEALALASVLRVVNLSFVLIPEVTLRFVAVYGVMFIPIILVVAHRKLSRHDLGLTGGFPLAYFIPLGTLVGVELALIEHQILANPALIPSNSLVWLAELSVVMIVIVLVEELLFRALLQPELVKRRGPLVGILITSIIFGAMQSGFANYYELLFAFGAGLVFGVAFYKTKNLPFVITMHAASNVLLFGVLPFLPLLAVRL